MITQTAINHAKQFDQEHGESITHGDFIYFEDGAYRELNPMGMSHVPDDNNPEKKQSRQIIQFWKMKLAHASDQFLTLKEHYVKHAKVGANETRGIGLAAPAETEEAVSKLKELKAEVSRCQKKLEKVEANFGTKKTDRELQQEKLNAANRAANADLLSAVEKIEI